LNDVEDVAVVKRSLPSFGSAAVGGRIASPTRQYVKDLSDPMFTGIGSAKLDRQQQQQQTVPRRQEEHQPADGCWQNEAFATDDISWEKLQTTRL
jgi:hypothetical protein